LCVLGGGGRGAGWVRCGRRAPWGVAADCGRAGVLLTNWHRLLGWVGSLSIAIAAATPVYQHSKFFYSAAQCLGGPVGPISVQDGQLCLQDPGSHAVVVQVLEQLLARGERHAPEVRRAGPNTHTRCCCCAKPWTAPGVLDPAPGPCCAGMESSLVRSSCADFPPYLPARAQLWADLVKHAHNGIASLCTCQAGRCCVGGGGISASCGRCQGRMLPIASLPHHRSHTKLLSLLQQQHQPRALCAAAGKG
jgi:hypothetical protein